MIATAQWDSNRACCMHCAVPGHTGHVARCARDAPLRMAESQPVHPVFNPFDDAADHAARRLSAWILAKEF